MFSRTTATEVHTGARHLKNTGNFGWHGMPFKLMDEFLINLLFCEIMKRKFSE